MSICLPQTTDHAIPLPHINFLRPVMCYAGASLLSRPKILYPRKRSHGQHLALLAAAFAALKLYPPQLFRALGELFKQQKHVLWLLGPQESMLLLWAIAEVQHKDPPAQLLLTQRATTQVTHCGTCTGTNTPCKMHVCSAASRCTATSVQVGLAGYLMRPCSSVPLLFHHALQVGQLDCQGLAHAYTQCASGRLTAPPLLSALRKATRQRLRGMQPQHLTAILVALAGLGQQNPLLLDELSG